MAAGEKLQVGAAGERGADAQDDFPRSRAWDGQVALLEFSDGGLDEGSQESLRPL